MTPDKLAVGIVALNGGQLVGRTRLQKTAYLLDACGMKSGMQYDYHYYGPYSFALAEGWETAKREQRLHVNEKPGRHGVSYYVFVTEEKAPEKLGAFTVRRAAKILERLKEQSDLVLEVAATLVFLGRRPDVSDAVTEVKRRKPLKATDERLKAASRLLDEIGLSYSRNK